MAKRAKKVTSSAPGSPPRRPEPVPAVPSTPPDRLRCSKCGCGHLPVVYTRHVGGAIRRLRECRACGHRFQTRERA